MEKNNFKEKNLIDTEFSALALFVLIVFYWLLSVILNGISASNFVFVVFLGFVFVPSLFVNVLIQTFLNYISVKNKIKSYLFFIALNIEMILFSIMFFTGEFRGNDTGIVFIFILFFIFIKYLVTRYYYKKLQKITNNSKN